MNANILNDADFAAAFTAVKPQDFVRTDGSYDLSPLNLGDPAHVKAVNDFKRSLRNPAGGIDQAVPGSDDLEEIA